MSKSDSRKLFVGGNWKMNLRRSSGVQLATSVAGGLSSDAVQVVVCPAFVYLEAVAEAVSDKKGLVQVGAQDIYFHKDGAYTGEINADMLKDVGVSLVLTGHSERRHVIGEPDSLINEKTLAALEAGLEVILCIGETLEQRQAGKTDDINAGQLSLGLAGVSADKMSKVTIAYEPVWAIGTGETATAQDAQNAHQAIRSHLKGMYNNAVADAVRIQYGGSVKPANASELFAQQDIDGGLIGGAALKANDFLEIINAAAKVS